MAQANQSEVLTRLTAPGPKRILALDGGGIRGVLTLGFLDRIEQILRTRHQNPQLRLCDYFDLIGGTSTGSIIASALAIGMEVAEIKRFYLDLGGRIFGKKKLRFWESFYDVTPLRQALQDVFGDRTLDDSTISTGLCLILKRADTGSTWPIFNHPKGRYFATNRTILLREAIRASSAAPPFFEPQVIEVLPGQQGVFLDGGISTAKNPALTLFYLATLKGFHLDWPTGEEQMLLVSLGTGMWKDRVDPQAIVHGKFWSWVKQVPEMLIQSADQQNQLLLQLLSTSPTPWMIDREIGDLSNDSITPAPLMTYLRYDACLEAAKIKDIGLPELAASAVAMRDMTNAERRYDLAKVGERAAEIQIQAEHFPKVFDLMR
jgi:patatin-like phospholipase/acyl hydrolase